MSPEAVIFMGIQATGKSSFFRERFFRSHVRISLDLLRTRHRERALLQMCLETSQSFVVDNTNPTPEDRARYVPAAREAGFRVAGFYFQSSLEAALDRNSRRPAEERIPKPGILGTLARLVLPNRGEGFDALSYVRIDDEGSFVVEEWSDAV